MALNFFFLVVISQWYLERDLAVLIDEDPPTIQLKFSPAGSGNSGSEFYLSEKQNRCVSCGLDKDYLRHSIVPHSYRKFLPVPSIPTLLFSKFFPHFRL